MPDTWEPLGAHHIASFFKRPPFSVVPHLKTLQRRRLTEARPPERRLAVGECLDALKELKGQFKGFPDSLKSIHADLKAGKFGKLNVREILSKLQDFGRKIREFDFAELGRMSLDGLFASLAIADVLSTWKEVEDMKKQAREVIDTIKSVGQVVRDLGNDILDLLERSDSDHFISQVLASSDSVFDPQVDKIDELNAVCRAFDYSQGPLLVEAMSNFQLCTRKVMKSNGRNAVSL